MSQELAQGPPDPGTPAAAHRELVAAVAAALAEDPDPAGRPSRFRSRLVRGLGPSAELHRTEIHLLTVALEERVPSSLRRHGIIGPEEIKDEVASLSSLRGLRSDAAERAVRIWAHALEQVGEVSSSRQPASDLSDPLPAAPVLPSWALPAEAPTPTPGDAHTDGPPQADAPTETADVALERPHSDVSDGVGSAPGHHLRRNPGDFQGDATELPGRGFDPSATEVPDTSSVLATSAPTSTPPPPLRAATDGDGPADAGASPLPTGEVHAFRQRNPLIRWVVAAACLAIGVPVVLLTPGPVGTPILLACLMGPLLLMNVVLSQGLLRVDDTGLSFRRTRGRGGDISVPWAEVSGVEDGLHPRIVTTAGPIWLGWKQADAAAAIRARAAR